MFKIISNNFFILKCLKLFLTLYLKVHFNNNALIIPNKIEINKKNNNGGKSISSTRRRRVNKKKKKTRFKISLLQTSTLLEIIKKKNGKLT